MKGTVKFFNQRKNYGFIEPEEGSKDLFVHRNDVEGGALQDGDKVEFESVEGDRGLKAVKVKKIS